MRDQSITNWKTGIKTEEQVSYLITAFLTFLDEALDSVLYAIEFQLAYTLHGDATPFVPCMSLLFNLF